MRRIRTDLLVIGAGSGGLSVAAGAARMGADVTLLEGGAMGGDARLIGLTHGGELTGFLKRLERFWTDQIRYIY